MAAPPGEPRLISRRPSCASNTSVGDIDDRGDLLHHPKHTQAILDRCRELGVPAIADVPSLGLKPPPDGPTQLRTFLLKHLTGKPAGD